MIGQSFLPRVGGEELGMDLLAREFAKAGHDVTVHVQHVSWLKSPPALDLPYRVVWYRKARSRSWAAPFLRRSLKRLYKSWPYDILYCRKLYPTGHAALLAARDLQVPLVLSVHDSWTIKPLARPDSLPAARQSPRLSREQKRAREILAGADAVIALNEYMRTYILGLCPSCDDHIHLIPNGVEVDCFAKPAGETSALVGQYADRRGRFFLFIGKLARVKGVDVLIEAFRSVVASHPDALLLIAGDGAQALALQRQAHAAGLQEHVHFVGTVRGDDRIWLLQQALCVVVPSRIETFGKVTVEAFACGTPVVGSRLGGIAELIEPGVNGLLVEVDEPVALAGSLCQLLNDPEGRQRMAEQARATAQRYAVPAVAQQCLALFEQVMATRGAARPRL